MYAQNGEKHTQTIRMEELKKRCDNNSQKSVPIPAPCIHSWRVAIYPSYFL